MNQTAADFALFGVTCTIPNSLTLDEISTPDVIYILELAVTLDIHRDHNGPYCPCMSYVDTGHYFVSPIYEAWSLYNFTPLFITPTLTTSRS